MRKWIAVLLTFVLTLVTASCGVPSSGNESNSANQGNTTTAPVSNTGTPVRLNETASTDIVDFTLKDANLSYFASSSSSTFAAPIDADDGGIYTAATGRVLVILTFEITNKDRGSLNVNDRWGGWKFDFKLDYKDTQYPIRGYDLNNKDGDSFGVSLSHGAISRDGGITWEIKDTANEIMDAGQTLTFRVVTVAVVNPASLTDPFSITVNVPSSSGTDALFTYAVG